MVTRRRPQNKQICFMDDIVNYPIINCFVLFRTYPSSKNVLDLKNDSKLCTENMTGAIYIIIDCSFISIPTSYISKTNAQIYFVAEYVKVLHPNIRPFNLRNIFSSTRGRLNKTTSEVAVCMRLRFVFGEGWAEVIGRRSWTNSLQWIHLLK